MRTTSSTATGCRFEHLQIAEGVKRRRSVKCLRSDFASGVSASRRDRSGGIGHGSAALSPSPIPILSSFAIAAICRFDEDRHRRPDRPLHGLGLYGQGGRHHDARRHLLPGRRSAARCLVGDGETRFAACSGSRQGTQAARHHLCAGRSTGSADRIGERGRVATRLYIRGRVSATE